MWRIEGESWSVLYGTIYDMKDFVTKHPGGESEIKDFLGKDATRLFPRTPVAQLPKTCLNPEIDTSKLDRIACADFTGLEELTLHCHTSLVGRAAVHDLFKENVKGRLVYTYGELADLGGHWISIHDRIYNVTKYVNDMRSGRNNAIDLDSENAYLDRVLTKMIVNKLNEDATQVFEDLLGDYTLLDCMDELFFIGELDERFDMACYILQCCMYGLMFFIAAMLVVQVLCSMMYLARKLRSFSEEDSRSYVMVMVPCYNEGLDVLKKTIDSVCESDYTDENKVLCVVTDGIIKGKGESHVSVETSGTFNVCLVMLDVSKTHVFLSLTSYYCTSLLLST